jgi:hypothetical protein
MARWFSRELAIVEVADIKDTFGKLVNVEVSGEFVHLDMPDSRIWKKLMTIFKLFNIIHINVGELTLSPISRYALRRISV